MFFFPFRCSKWVQPNKPKTQLRFKPSVFLLSAPTITRLPLRRLGAGERLSPPRGFPLTSLDLCRQAGVGARKRGAEGVAGGGMWVPMATVQVCGEGGRSGGVQENQSTCPSQGQMAPVDPEPAFYWMFTVQQFLNRPPAFSVELLFLKNTKLK